jgi:hypothetical protein
MLDVKGDKWVVKSSMSDEVAFVQGQFTKVQSQVEYNYNNLLNNNNTENAGVQGKVDKASVPGGGRSGCTNKRTSLLNLLLHLLIALAKPKLNPK